MVSAVLADALTDPLAVLHALQGPSDDLPARAAAHFRAIFKDNDALKQIPPLDMHSYAHSLVRFRAMVQDTSFSPEMYPALLPSGHLGGWGLAETHPPSDLDVHNLRERDIVWAISIPGESPFVSDILDDPESPHRERESNRFRHKDPLSRPHHLGVQIKIYDTPASLKPTELRTFVGFLTLEHASIADDDNASEESPPLPTLHVLFSVPHPPTLLPFSYPLSHPETRVRDVRQALIRWLADEALGGDTDAAEWVLLACVARVQSREPPLLPLTLTLSKFPPPPADTPARTPALIHILQRVLPLLVPLPLSLPLSLPLLNDPSRPFAPVSRGETLHAGMLQLPAGTVVCVTEGGVGTGTVNEGGLKNIQTLRTAITSQTLAYEFPFAAPYMFPTDLGFVVLSEGRKSAFVDTQVTLPMHCTTPEGCYKTPENITLPEPATLAAFRALICAARTDTVRVSEDISQHIQDEFVRERQGVDRESVTAEDLMTRMAVARLMALSRGDAELGRDVWAMARELDGRRKGRVGVSE